MTQLSEPNSMLVETDAPRDRACDAIVAWEAFMERVREMDRRYKDSIVGWIKVNGPIEIGTVMYYVGTPKVTRCRDVGETARTLLELFGPQGICHCLSSDAWKHGQVRKMLAEIGSGDLFDRLFETTRPDRLQRKEHKSGEIEATAADGAGQLQRVDRAFVR